MDERRIKEEQPTAETFERDEKCQKETGKCREEASREENEEETSWRIEITQEIWERRWSNQKENREECPGRKTEEDEGEWAESERGEKVGEEIEETAKRGGGWHRWS